MIKRILIILALAILLPAWVSGADSDNKEGSAGSSNRNLEAGRIVVIHETMPGQEKMPASLPNYTDWRNSNQSFESMAAFVSRDFSFTLDGTEKVKGYEVSVNFFDVTNIHPRLGRSFTEDEDKPGYEKVAMLSMKFWEQRLRADKDILGRTLEMDGKAYTIVGVLPPGMTVARDGDVFVPFIPTEKMNNRGFRFLNVVARLKQGVTVEQAQAEMDSIAARLRQNFPDTNKGSGVKVSAVR
jgi:putative ABC transport system permease protein